MEFSLVEKEGVPDELMKDFYNQGGEAGNFGTTERKAESSEYDTLVLVTDQEVVGSADLLVYDNEAKLHGCYILPEYREKLEKNGKSAFENMAAARLGKTDLPTKISATIEHGKTQHVYDKLGFSPYKFKLPKSEYDSGHIMMADRHEDRRFDYEIYVPDSVRDFVNHISEAFGQETGFREGEYRGIDVSFIEDMSEENYSSFKVEDGSESLKAAVNQILEAKEEDVNVRVDVDASDSSAYRFVSELMDEDFTPTAFEPVIETSRIFESPIIQLAYSGEPIEAEIVPETAEFLKAAGWDLKVVNRDEKSEKVKIKSN